MNNNNTNSDILVQYLDNELSQEDKSNVENQLKHDNVMQKELENLSLAKSAIKTYGLKKHISTIHAEMMNEMIIEKGSLAQKGTVRQLINITMKVAAAVLIVLLGLGVYQYASITPDKLFASNYKPYALSVNRGLIEKDGMEKSFQEKNYNAIITQFSLLNESSAKENFLVGQAYLETNNYKKAIESFKSIMTKNMADGKTTFNDDAQYFLALSYLRNHDVKLATPIFEAIHNNVNHLYNDKMTPSFMRNLKILNWKY
jgi:tetratricopeptide (TPR) repeat protein